MREGKKQNHFSIRYVVPPSLKEVVSPRIFPSPFGRATPYLKELREGLG